MVGVRNDVQEENASKVRSSMEMEKDGMVLFTDGETLVCHSFLPDGRYYTEYFDDDLLEVARWVCATDKDKLICNNDDLALASTMGTLLDLCVDSFREEFLDILIQCQEEC